MFSETPCLKKVRPIAIMEDTDVPNVTYTHTCVEANPPACKIIIIVIAIIMKAAWPDVLFFQDPAPSSVKICVCVGELFVNSTQARDI